MDNQTRSPPRKRAKVVKMPSTKEELEEASPDAMEEASPDTMEEAADKLKRGYFLFVFLLFVYCFAILREIKNVCCDFAQNTR